MAALAVLGAGAWGTALAASVASRHGVTLWARDPAQAGAIASARRNARYLPEIALPEALRVEADLQRALEGAELLIAATPVAGLRELVAKVRLKLPNVPLIWLCKGFEQEGAALPHEIVAASGWRAPSGALSGPSFALEVAKGLPCALTLASADAAFAARTAALLHGGRLRVYHSDDLVGVEIGGAVKNVLAIAVGICDGLGLGQNARAALITRGLAEITRLGVKMGGRPETFTGLTGAGDLILTCTGDLSRNRRVGLALAQGKKLDDILREIGHVTEGVYTAAAVERRAQELCIDMPITQAVCAVLFGRASPREAVERLLARDPKVEI